MYVVMIMSNLSCTFFGHRDCGEDIMPKLYSNIEQIIAEKGCKVFYVGNHGNFDAMASKLLQILKQKYEIKVYIVLAYMPITKTRKYRHDTLLPEEIAGVPPKYAIIYRNKWMIEKSDFVITYVRNDFGGAASSKEYAVSKNKKIIELYK